MTALLRTEWAKTSAAAHLRRARVRDVPSPVIVLALPGRNPPEPWATAPASSPPRPRRDCCTRPRHARHHEPPLAHRRDRALRRRRDRGRGQHRATCATCSCGRSAAAGCSPRSSTIASALALAATVLLTCDRDARRRRRVRLRADRVPVLHRRPVGREPLDPHRHGDGVRRLDARERRRLRVHGLDDDRLARRGRGAAVGLGVASQILNEIEALGVIRDVLPTRYSTRGRACSGRTAMPDDMWSGLSSRCPFVIGFCLIAWWSFRRKDVLA